MVEMISCSNGHKFTVNPKKHRDRTYVMCPHRGCHEQVKIHKRRDPFSKMWREEREQLRAYRLFVKERGRKHKPLPAYIYPAARSQMAGILALSTLMAKQEKERAKEGEKKK